jgi:hypothetical protein
MTEANPLQPLPKATQCMGMVCSHGVRQFPQRSSRNLLRLGYLQPAKRFKPHIVERALARLRADLVRDGVVKGGSPLNDRIPAAPDDNQQPSAVPSPSAST